ncbi:MAG TPA: hypothetical protein VN903_29975 [Polyangia bacterium]|jgi:hypothetical protein|nr:hypothetical protein [Polyangia bacterium]
MTNMLGLVGRLVVGSTVVAMLVSLFARTASAADGRIRVLQETPVSPAADIPANVRKECTGLGDELPRAIMRSSRRVALVPTHQELAEKTGRYLHVEITNVSAHGGGAFTGPKHLKVRGSLIENGREIADFEAERGSMAAASTCSTLNKAEKDLGADIGVWLENPKPRSRLGDAK